MCSVNSAGPTTHMYFVLFVLYWLKSCKILHLISCSFTLIKFAGICINCIIMSVSLGVIHTLVITTEKTNILLRYLHHQLDKQV